MVRTDAERRDDCLAGLTERGIGTSVHFIPLHLHSYYRDIRLPSRRLPGGARKFERAVSLPIWSAMTEQDVERVVSAVRDSLVPGVIAHHRRLRFPRLAPGLPAASVEADVPSRSAGTTSLTPTALAASLAGADTIYHLAGVNRAGSETRSRAATSSSPTVGRRAARKRQTDPPGIRQLDASTARQSPTAAASEPLPRFCVPRRTTSAAR